MHKMPVAKKAAICLITRQVDLVKQTSFLRRGLVQEFVCFYVCQIHNEIDCPEEGS